MESVSAVFAHDIATPLTTAQLNADLLIEHLYVLTTALDSKEAEKIPQHIKQAIANSPQLISQSLKSIRGSLEEYKSYLNSVHEDEDAYQIKPETSENAHFLKKLKILLVDDEAIHHDIGEVVLGKQHDLHHESSGQAAIDRCREEDFELILMDLQMPNLNGMEAVEELRKFIPESTLIFGLTSMPIQKQKNNLRTDGFDNFLDKPLKISAFNKLIESPK